MMAMSYYVICPIGGRVSTFFPARTIYCDTYFRGYQDVTSMTKSHSQLNKVTATGRCQIFLFVKKEWNGEVFFQPVFSNHSFVKPSEQSTF